MSTTAPPIPPTPPHVSINRVRIVDIPGVTIDDSVRGQTAYSILSTEALVGLARTSAGPLHLPVEFSEDTLHTKLNLPLYVDACLNSQQSDERAAAEEIGRRLGRNLGHILLTLHRGDAINRAVRHDWTNAEWERWRHIRQVWLAGGLVSGNLGQRIVFHAREFLTEIGYAEAIAVGLSTHRHNITLLGSGRYLPAQTGDTLVFDFGHTRAKSACLRFDGGKITGVYPFSPVPVKVSWLEDNRSHNSESGRELLDFISTIVARTHTESMALGFDPAPDLMLVLAAYVEGGKLLGNGLYVNLNHLADDAHPLLASAIRARISKNVRVHLIHDGIAAAAVHAGESHTVVLMVGTALGVGFPPELNNGRL